MSLFKRIDALLVRVINPIVVVIGLAVAIMLAVGIVSRAMLGTPVFGLEEIMLLAIMWFYMLGASMASRERSHLSCDFVKVFSSDPRVWRGAALVSTAISLFVAVMIVTWSWDLFSFSFARGQATPVFWIPWWISQLSVLVASILFVIYLLRDLFLEITGRDLHLGESPSQGE